MRNTIQHSILVISYNQEKTIGKTLESILSQVSKNDEIIISDDNSQDRTIDIVENYVKEYPEKNIKIIKNEQNLGVFGNLNNVIKYANGDFVNIVAGDDLLPFGILQTYSDFIEANHLNCDESFLICTDSEILKSDEKKYYISNKDILKYGLADMTIMCSLYFWETGMSMGLVKKLPKYREDIGYQADWLFHVDRLSVINHCYYLPISGYIYREGCGVTNASKASDLMQSRQNVLNIINAQPEKLTDKSRQFLKMLGSDLAYRKKSNMSTFITRGINRIRLGKVPQNCEYRSYWKFFIPQWIKTLIKNSLFIR